MNSRFAIAVHILTFLTLFGNEPTTSDYIAGSVSTSPVVIRRILGSLRKAGLVTAQPGTGGGSMLARPAAEITLLAVYRATGPDNVFALHRHSPNADCVCGGNIQPVLREVFGAAESALEEALSSVTVAQVANEIVQRADDAGKTAAHRLAPERFAGRE